MRASWSSNLAAASGARSLYFTCCSLMLAIAGPLSGQRRESGALATPARPAFVARSVCFALRRGRPGPEPELGCLSAALSVLVQARLVPRGTDAPAQHAARGAGLAADHPAVALPAVHPPPRRRAHAAHADPRP